MTRHAFWQWVHVALDVDAKCWVILTSTWSLSYMARSQYWCFTLNNYNESEEQALQTLCTDNEIVTFCTYGREVGTSNGTRHLQGYLELSRRLRLNQVKSLLGQRYHLEKRRGTSKEAADYCQKEDATPFVYGTRSVSNQGKRTDLEEVCNAIRNGATKRSIAFDYPTTFVKYHKGLEVYTNTIMAIHNPPKFHGPFRWSIPDTGSIIIWGDSGIGKTEFAKYNLPKALFVTHMDDLVKFNPDIYNGIIFDDMSFSHLHREAQIHLVDQDNPRSIHVRYTVATIPANTKKLFLTNVHNGMIFLNDPAINRRITIFHFE